MTTWASDEPLISVVVPTRDRPALLERALTAILGQDYAGPVECIVVFDQSLPSLPRLEISERRSVRAVPNTRTPGLAGARNTGILQTAGELIAFCDDDDEWIEDKLSRQVAALVSSPGCLVVTTGVISITGAREHERVLQTREITHAMLLRSRVMEAHSSTLLIRRSALLGSVGLIDEDIPGSYAEDYEWLLRASRVSPLIVVPLPLVRVDMHPKSYFSEQWRTIASAIHYLLNRHPDLRSDPQGLARLYGRLAIAEAELGHRREAWRYALRSIRLQRTQHRAYVGMAITTGLLTADRAIRLANRAGRGI